MAYCMQEEDRVLNSKGPLVSGVVSFEELTYRQVALGGGKGASLGELARAGFPVPPGFIVCTNVFTQAIEENGVTERIADLVADIDYANNSSLLERAETIKRLIRDIQIPAVLQKDILRAYYNLGVEVPVAVRSSATTEDLGDASFAGQHETFLFVTGGEELLFYIKECWASLYNQRAMFYRYRQGFEQQGISIAVVVQQMIDADKAGIIFTLNPVSKQESNMVIEASWGLGEAVVSGLVTPDNYIFDKEKGELIAACTSIKSKMITRSPKGKGTAIKNVPCEKRTAQVLSFEEIIELANLGKRLEQFYGCPQDIEWAIKEGRIYILQSRPITTL